jgi:hypothetical protein
MELYPFPAHLVNRLAQGESISPTEYAEAREQIIADERAILMAIKRHVFRTALYDGRRWEAIVGYRAKLDSRTSASSCRERGEDEGVRRLYRRTDRQHSKEPPRGVGRLGAQLISDRADPPLWLPVRSRSLPQ